MARNMPTWSRWALFAAGAAALSAIPFALAFTHVVRGVALPIVLFAWFVVYLTYVFFGAARLKAGQIGPAMKRHRGRLAVTMTSYCLVLMGSIYLLYGVDLSGPLLFLVFPLFCLSWGLSQPFIRRRYQ